MIVDVKFDGKKLVIIHDSDYEFIEGKRPYFYIIYNDDKVVKMVKRTVTEQIDDIVETGYKAIVAKSSNRYDIDDRFKVAKVLCPSPRIVPDVASRLISIGIRCSAFNVRYVARCVLDSDISLFDVEPLYFGLDTDIIEKVRKVRALVIDVEAVKNRPVLCSAYLYKPFEEVRKDDVQHFKLPDEVDELQKLIEDNMIIVGHNVLGFDIPMLRQCDITIDINKRCIVDTSALLANWGSSFQVGSARSLLDVAKAVKDQAGITDEEIELKERSRGKVEKMSWNELVRYNINDVVITSKLLNIFLTFLAVISGLTQIPLSVIQSTSAGIIAEYFLLHDLELRGLVPEYRKVDWRVSSHKVYIYKQNYVCGRILKYDVKMMYPSYVLNNYIDPTLIVSDAGVTEGVEYKLEHNIDTKITFSPNSGIGAIWSTVRKLYEVRKMTKELKKKEQLFEIVDKAVKAILNALAYGVQGKRSGYAILGNVAVPVKIFLGTTRITFELIEEMNRKNIRVIYSDTDSFFIEDRGYDPNELLNIINSYLKKYGLEVDYEGSYEQAYIITRKSYILIGNDIVIKGGKIRMKLKFFLPQCVAKKFIEIVRTNPKERPRLIKEIVDSAPVEELFASPAQQLWRLIGRDPQAVKREISKGKEYVKVRTPWETKPTIYLKKGYPSTFAMPYSSPLITLLINNKNYTLYLADFEPYYIVEANYLYIPTDLNIRLPVEFWRRENVRGIYYINDRLYLIGINNIYYILEDRYGACYSVETTRVSSEYNNYTITAVHGKLKVKELKIDEKLLREIAYRVTIHQVQKIFEVED